LKIHELRQYFYRVYGNVGIFNKAQALRKLIRKNRLSLEDCIYVADETRDIKACKTTGIRCVAVNGGFADPTLLAELKPYGFVTTPNELKQLIVNDNNKVVGA
jgi:phosphoglycolate phosphatase-like HAD superfamily hydrolase